MTTAPLEFLHKVLPAHFAKGVAALREATGPDAKEKLDDVVNAKGCVRVTATGIGEVWLGVENGVMTPHSAKPDLPVRAALAFEGEVAQGALELLTSSGRMDDPKAPARFAKVASVRAEKILAGQKIEFHVIITDVPERDEDVVIKVGIGVESAPEKPQFTATISYDDLEDMREGELAPNQVMGRLRLRGDASKAMAVGMMLMQPPKPPAKK